MTDNLDLYEIPASEIAKFAFGPTDTFWLCLANVDWHDEKLPSLNVLVLDAMSGEVLHQEDPIHALINFCIEEDREDASSRINLAIAALQSGIDRLRAHEAKRRQAQS